ncbi:MAG: DciA family protein [Candidatus Latescibacterota bacterium]
MNNLRREGGRARKANPVSIQRVIVPLSASLGLSSDIHLEKLKKNWRTIVGAANAAHTRPTTLRNGILTVSVVSPAWMTQARFYTSTFLKNINSFDPRNGVEVREVRFTLERF